MKQILPVLKKLSLCGLAICSILFTASAQEKISLQKAVDMTLERNLTIKQAAFTEAFDEATLQQSKYNRLPSLSSTIQASDNFGRALDVSTYQYTHGLVAINPSLNAQATIFQGGQLRNQIIQNKLAVDADKSSTAKIKNDLVLNVIVSYLQILTNLDLVTAAKQQTEIARQTLDRAQINFKVGNQTLADLSQAKAGLSTSDYNLTSAQNQLDLSMLILKQYMEMPPTTQIAVEKPDLEQFKDIRTTFNAQEVISTALTVNPDVKLAEAQQAVYAQAINVARATFYPTLTLFTNVNSNYSSLAKKGFIDPTNGALVYGPYTFGNQITDNLSPAIGLSLQIPIFNRFNARTNVKKAKINYDNAAISTQIAKNNLSKTIIQAIYDAGASEKQYQSALQTYQANKDAFNVTQLRYNVGLVNSLDYNTSLTNLNKSQNDMIQARYQMVFRSKVIDYYLGNPIKL